MPTPAFHAERVLNELSISDPQDLFLLREIAWERGALVVDKPLDGAEARIAIVGRRAVISLSTHISDPRRRRFSIAHELGHFEIHRRDSHLALCSGRDLDDWNAGQAARNYEQEANEFASALLLPERFFRPLCQEENPSLGLISTLGERFDVSLTAAARRFVQFTPEACALVFSDQGFIRWFSASQEFLDMGLFVDVKSKLDPASQAASRQAGPVDSIRPQRVRASAWLKPGRYRRDATLLEQSLWMPAYNTVLSLIWIDEDVQNDDEDYL